MKVAVYKSVILECKFSYIDDLSGAVTDDAVDVVTVGVALLAVVVVAAACPVPKIT